MEIALIWAMARNRVIGRDNGLPWRLPDDMRHFRTTTLGQPVIMGRRTFESMPGALPRRTNIVLTSAPGYRKDNVHVAGDFDSALAIARQKINASAGDTAFVIGGAGVYELAMPVADRLFVTWIDAEVGGDTWFPEVDWSRWRETSSTDHAADARHEYPFRIATYIRKQN